MKEKVLNWLDNLARNQKERFSLTTLYDENGEELSNAFDSEPIIHIYNINEICEIAGITPEVEQVKVEGETSKKYSFIYNDVVFFGLGGF